MEVNVGNCSEGAEIIMAERKEISLNSRMAQPTNELSYIN